MKTYRGTFIPGIAKHVVEVQENGESHPLRHHLQHSPNGFNWGYSGSGPSELARSVLIDHLGVDEVDPRVAQRFKEEFVATWPMNGGWELKTETIAAWLAGDKK